MWDVFEAILSGVAVPVTTWRQTKPVSFAGRIVIASVIVTLAAGAVLISFLPEGWVPMVLIQMLALALLLIAAAEVRGAWKDRRRTAP